MSPTQAQFIKEPFAAYHQRGTVPEDAFLTHVGPGTPCGEYLRRFWQPVAYSHELTDLPLRRRIMGEDLVLFRDGRGEVGLLELHCSHRGTSLEYGRIEERGIRCCYHGWLFDVDGKILDTPLEPAHSTLKDRFYHGAYPVREHTGAVWAYMGQPDKVPDLWALDLLNIPGYRLECGEVHGAPNVKECNWLQIVDNFVDPQHEGWLHAEHSGVQFTTPDGTVVERLTMLGESEFIETRTSIVTLEMRRLDDETVWVRNIEYIWPNIAALGQMATWPPILANGEDEQHSIPYLLLWAVPIDDVNMMEVSLVLTPEGEKNPRTKDEAPALTFNASGRTYQEMQREPGDYEAQIGQGPIAIHAREHLATSDRGVAMMRRGIREAIEAVQEGKDPPNVFRDGKLVPTYAGDTALRVPKVADAAADAELLRQAGRDLIDRYVKNGGHTGLCEARAAE
jgi:nitrite reductase/ring-hydroxylating ferredoxin subunit